MKERELYVVKTSHGYLSTRRFNHHLSSFRYDDMPFEMARVFTRKSDAQNAADDEGLGSKVVTMIASMA